MRTGQQCLFGGAIVTIRGSHSHVVSGHTVYLIEHADGSFSRAGAESLAPLESEPEKKAKVNSLGSIAAMFLRTGKKRRVMFR